MQKKEKIGKHTKIEYIFYKNNIILKLSRIFRFQIF